MIRLLLLLCIGAGIYLLWDKTSLPNVEPLSREELATLMKEEGNPSGKSLRAAFAGVAQALEEKPPLQGLFTPEELALTDSSPELREYVQSKGTDPHEAARLILSSIETLAKEDWNSRQRLLKLAQSLGAREKGLYDAAYISIGLRQLEVPTDADLRDPAALEVIRSACELVATRTPDPAKRAALLTQLLPLHASEAVREEIEKAFKPQAPTSYK